MERSPHLKLLNEAERIKYERAPYKCFSENELNYGTRMADFNPEFKQAGLFKVLGPQNDEYVIDLRKLPDSNNSSCTHYTPFEVNEQSDGILYCGLNAGWLTLLACKDVMHICRIDNFDNSWHNRLGSALVQFAIEKSIEAGLGGKISLVSTNGSSVFFYKLGFVCENPENQKDVEKAYLHNERGSDGRNMYLPDEAINAWKKKIRENPIFLKTIL
jgi:hypothetical protein